MDYRTFTDLDESDFLTKLGVDVTELTGEFADQFSVAKVAHKHLCAHSTYGITITNLYARSPIPAIREYWKKYSGDQVWGHDLQSIYDDMAGGGWQQRYIAAGHLMSAVYPHAEIVYPVEFNRPYVQKGLDMAVWLWTLESKWGVTV